MKKKSKAPKARAAKYETRDLITIVTKIKRTFRDDIFNIISAASFTISQGSNRAPRMDYVA